MTRATSLRTVAALLALAATAAVLAMAAPAGAAVALTRVSADPFTNATSQHATEVEPDTFASGSTVVAAYQVGRFFDGGATRHRLCAARATAARRGTSGLPARAHVQRRRRSRTGQPVRARQRPERRLRRQARRLDDLVDPDPPDGGVPTVFVSRSTDGGATFGNPVEIPPPAGQEGRPRQELDRLRQPREQPVLRPLLHGVRQLRRGRPGVHEHVDRRRRDLERPVAPAGNPRAWAASRSSSPNGTVIVPFESLKGTIGAFRSTDGGADLVKEVAVSKIRFHGVAGDLRTSPLPTAEIDGGRARLRRLGGLPLRAEVHGERHRLQHVARRR